MNIDKYITFTRSDVVEALEDFYQKQTGNRIDINFDEKNLRRLNSIIIKVSLEKDNSIKGEIDFEPSLGIQENFSEKVEYYDMEEKSSLK